MKCQQCWDHRCIKENCRCRCHIDYDRQLASNTKKMTDIIKKDQDELEEMEKH